MSSYRVKNLLILAYILQNLCRCEDDQIANVTVRNVASGRSFAGETLANSETTKSDENSELERAFDLNGLAGDDYRAHPHHTFSKQPLQTYGVPQTSYGIPEPVQQYGAPAPVLSYPQNGASLIVPANDGYHYPVTPSSQYLPPPPQPAGQQIETFDSFQPIDPFTNSTLEINSPSTMFIQAGKCSNSVEIGRTRDVEIRTTIKYGTETNKGVCVLMLYANSELNKLAVSLQAVQGTTNILPKGTWLETNVKMYAVSAGGMQPIIFK